MPAGPPPPPPPLPGVALAAAAVPNRRLRDDDDDAESAQALQSCTLDDAVQARSAAAGLRACGSGGTPAALARRLGVRGAAPAALEADAEAPRRA
jgi:hypothetical protein